MLRKNVIVVTLVAFAVGMVVACKKKGVLVGSCDRRASDAPRSLCIDAYDGKDGLTLSGCERDNGAEIPAGKKSEAACDHSGALAGCKFHDSIDWYFPSKRVKTIENVAAVCMGTLLGPDAKELTGIAKVNLKTDEQLYADEDVAKWKPDLEAKFAMIEKIGKSLPPRRKKLRPASSYVETKVLTVDAVDLPNIAANADVAHRDDASALLAQCVRIVRSGIKNPHASLDRCHDAKWVVIQRTASIREPVWLGSGTNRDAYKGGHAQGDVLGDNAKKDMAVHFEKQINIGRLAAIFEAEGRKPSPQ